MKHKLIPPLLKAAWVLEIVVGIAILVATVIQLVLVGNQTFSGLLSGQFDLDGFFTSIMTIVVGIEFLKMLILHTPRAVTDVLLFAIAKQLVVSHPSSVDTLLGVAAVVLIFLVKKFLHTDDDHLSAADRHMAAHAKPSEDE